MNPSRSPRKLLVLAMLSVATAGGLALWAAEKPVSRAPLKMRIDDQPIDRGNSARVSYAAVVKKTAPGVAYVFTSKKVRRREMENNPLFNDPMFRRYFRIPDQKEDRSPRDSIREGLGSGVIVTTDGYIITNNHVVDGADKVTVVFDDGKEMSAKVIGTDEKTDLAVVKVDGVTDLPFVKLADTEVRVGEWVVAVGNPFGLGGTVTAGIVSARGRDIAGSAYGDFLQIDAAVNTGNSGGPDFNLQGEVVGVNTAIFSPNGGNVGIAFAIPASVVKQVTGQLIESGTVTRGFLGVGIQDVTSDIADSVGLSSAAGALVTEPSKDSPADKAGVKSGDVVTAVDGQAISNALDLSRTIAGKNPGTAVELSIWRDGKDQKISVTLGKLEEAAAPAETQQQPPAEEPAAPAPTSVGLTLVPNAGGEGLLIQDVDPSSAAADKGFAVGDTVLEVNNQAVASVEDFEKAIQSVKDAGRSTALVKAQRDGNTRFIGLPITGDSNS